MEPDLLPQYPRIEITDLFHVAAHPDEIHRLYGDGITGPTAALIRFRKDGKVPAHTGYEHIIVPAIDEKPVSFITTRNSHE